MFFSWVYSRCLRQKRFETLNGWACYLRTLTAIQHVKSQAPGDGFSNVSRTQVNSGEEHSSIHFSVIFFLLFHNWWNKKWQITFWGIGKDIRCFQNFCWKVHNYSAPAGKVRTSALHGNKNLLLIRSFTMHYFQTLQQYAFGVDPKRILDNNSCSDTPWRYNISEHYFESRNALQKKKINISKP